MIIWVSGAFGAGKTTLADELHRRRPGAVQFDPEDLGHALLGWLPDYQDDFQHLPSWRELVIAAAVSLRKHQADTLIALDADVLRQRINARVISPDSERDAAIRAFCLSHVDSAMTAAQAPPKDTLLLRSDQLSVQELADEVLARAGSR